MDLLLLFVLSGVTLAFGKRIYSQAMGMHRTTRHVLGDRIALSVLWLIFPARLLAESITCALHGGGGISHGYDRRVDGASCQSDRPADAVRAVVVGLFDLSGAIFIVLPFSRYMHIFTEIPLIFCAATSCIRPRRRDRSTVSDRCLLAVRHLHRPLSVAERIGDRRRAVGLFPA